jgi:hypothetical protein
MKARSGLSLIAALTAVASCTALGRVQPDGRPPGEVAGPGPVEIAERSPMAAPKDVPVISPPEVFAVYVPGHVDRERDLFVGEHWVFFKLGESEWFAEARARRDPKAAGPAGEAALRALGGVEGYDRALVPHR